MTDHDLLDSYTKAYVKLLNEKILKIWRKKEKDGKIVRYKALPVMASTCYYRDIRHRSSSYSQLAYKNSYDDYPALKKRLREAGSKDSNNSLLEIGVKTDLDDCETYIGNCAEPHAARKCLKKEKRLNPGKLLTVDFDKFVFSLAVLVTGEQPRSPCKVCRRTFPTVRKPCKKK